MQSSKKISAFIKLSIVCLALWFLYQKVFSNESYSEVKIQLLSILSEGSYIELVLVVFLMFVNWSIDAIKWQFLVSKLEKVSFWLALKAVFLGITVSIFTPNRVGEFGGRVFCLQQADRLKAVLVTIFGNITQLVTTIIFGVLAFLFFSSQYTYLFFTKSDYGIYILIVLSIVVLMVLMYLLYNVSQLSSLFSRLKFLEKYKSYAPVFSLFSAKDISKVLFLSMLRYSVYSFQFYLLIKFANIEINLLQSLTMSALTFLSMSIIPTIALTELGVRGSVAIYFFGLLSSNAIGIITASFALWIINLVFPAIIGVFFVYQLKFFRK
ncbi:MAG: lysylphosphatidylglycerol synthase domain-containing protein [Flavobacteriales bacterium]